MKSNRQLINYTSVLMLLLVLSGKAWAEDYNYRTYNWEKNRKKTELSDSDRKESAIILKDFKGMEYDYDLKGELNLHTVVHKIIWVNTDEAIETYNKVYVPLWDVDDILDLRARTVKKDGTIIELDKNNIKELKNDETGGQMKIFAIEGVETDSEIEYFYILKKKATSNLYGGREYFQTSFPTRNAKFELISPANLEFKVKSYNDFAAPKVIEEGDRKIIQVMADKVESLKKEEFATYNANMKRVEYKLNINAEGSKEPLYTWDDAAKRIFENIYTVSEDGYKESKKLYKEIKPKGAAKQKIKAIENYIKTNFSIQPGYEDAYYLVEKIIENKYGNETGIMRLYACLLNLAKVEHQLVLTTDRSETRFDGEFSSWKYLENYVFYFPKTQKYLAPNKPELRYGMIPFYWTNNQGLFILPKESKKETIVTGKVDFIAPLASAVSFDNLTIDVEFGKEELENTNLKIESKTGGYYASNIQPYFPFLEQEQKDKVAKEWIGRYVPDAEFSKVEVFNTEKNISPLEKPFIVSGVGKGSSFVESAGSKYLFKLGSLIGPQVEMYQENTRQNPIENDFNRVYDRTITFNIPEGYKFKNLDDILIDKKHTNSEGKKIYVFESKYTVKEGKVEVRVVEFYDQINCSKEDILPFRGVVNAAADFNKITLVLEPISEN
jgi:gas vesicle protein